MRLAAEAASGCRGDHGLARAGRPDPVAGEMSSVPTGKLRPFQDKRR